MAPRGRAITVLGIFLFIMGLSLSELLFVFIGTLLILSIAVTMPLFYYTVSFADIIVMRILDKDKVFAGDFVNIKVTIENRSRYAYDLVEIRDNIPEVFEVIAGDNVAVANLPPGASFTYSYVLYPKMRGTYAIGPIRLVIKDRLGFFWAEREIPSITTITVYPSYEEIKRLDILSRARFIGMEYGVHSTKQKGIGMEFLMIREYEVGDEFRKIDWKATARTGKLMVKEFESERNVEIMIFLDSSKSMAVGPPEENKLEYSIRAIVTLVKMALERKDNVGLCVFSDRVHEFIKPKSSEKQFYDILDVLAKVSAGGRSNLANAIEYAISRLKRRTLFLIFTDLEAPSSFILEGIKLAVARGHSVVVISPFGPWFEVSAEELSPVERALAEALLIEMWEKRRAVAREIEKYGVAVVNVGPDDCIPAVISEYLKMKMRGLAQV